MPVSPFIFCRNIRMSDLQIALIISLWGILGGFVFLCKFVR